MFAASVCQSVCLSRGPSRLHCAKMAKQTQMLFGVNTSGGPWNIMLDVGPDPFTDRGRRPTFKLWGFLISPERLKLET